MYEVYNVLCYSLIIICRMSIMIAISKIMMFCLFSRAYSFQWNALYKKVMSHRNNPTKQGHMPKFAPQIQEHTIPIIINISPEISISLRYFFIIIPYSSCPYRWLQARRSAIPLSYQRRIRQCLQVSLLPP